MASYRLAALTRLLTTRHTQSTVARRCDIRNAGTITPAVQPKKSYSTLKLAVLGTTLGAATGTVYSIISNWRDINAHKEHERIPPKILKELPAGIKITKRYVNPKDTSNLDIHLFQFQTCPFCCKVRAYLDYMGISYSVIEVDAVLRQDIKWSEQKKVPMVLLRQGDGRYVQMYDSSAIISLIATYLNDPTADIGELAKFFPVISFFNDIGNKKHDIMNKYFLMFEDKTPRGLTKEMQEHERKWRTWADNHLVHLISPNCYRTFGEALETFEWFSQAGEWDIHFPRWERNLMVYAGASAMWVIAKMLKRRYDLTDDVRLHMYEALDKWVVELRARKTPFMGGKRPNLADLSVYGVLSSMEGCQTFKDCTQNTLIGEWYYRLQAFVQQNRGKLIRERIDGDLPPQLKSEVV